MGVSADMTQMPWIRWLDLDTEFGAGGSMCARLQRPKPEHLNHNGHVNAPVVYGVAEVAGAGAVVLAAGAAAGGYYTVISSATIHYRRPAQSCIAARAVLEDQQRQHLQDALAAARGGDIEVEVTLTDVTGSTTGTARFTVSLRPRRQKEPA